MKSNFAKRYYTNDGTVKERSTIKSLLVFTFAGIKFFFDRILSIIGLILLSPLMLIIAIIIKIDSKGPVIFKQERTGKRGKLFNIYKFRTMVANNNVRDFSKKDEHTRVGKLLRKTSLDEIPQLFSLGYVF